MSIYLRSRQRPEGNSRGDGHDLAVVCFRDLPVVLVHHPVSKSTRIPHLVLLLNAIVRGMLRLGVLMGPATLLTVRGRTSGQPRTTPVVLFENKGHRWLIAVFGEVNWVHNLRAAGEGILTRGHRRQKVVAVELTAEAAGAVLKDVLEPLLKGRPRARRILRPYYRVAPAASLNEFIKEAQHHPVFEVRESGVP